MSLDIPVLLISFNRPEMTIEAIYNIKKFQPSTIYFSVDGPRKDVIEDYENVQKCRQLRNFIDWECEVIEIFSDVNYGVGKWPHKVISEVLLKEKYLLIVEDDVRVSPEFYNLIKILLPRYENDAEVFSICASNISSQTKNSNSDGYFFTRYFACWGWATWSSKWKHYDYTIPQINMLIFWQTLKQNNFNILIFLYFMLNFYRIKIGKLVTWDYQVNYLIFRKKLINIKSMVNLSTNEGVGEKASHTKYLPKLEVGTLDLKKIKYKNNKSIDKIQEKKWRKARIKLLIRSWTQRIARK